MSVVQDAKSWRRDHSNGASTGGSVLAADVDAHAGFPESVHSVTCLEGDAEVGDTLIVLGSSYKGSYRACSC